MLTWKRLLLEAMAKKSVLMTPDPYHTPGYCGYVPQYKYQIGRTYGGHTHALLTDPAIPSSGNSVLGDTYPPTKHLQHTENATLTRTGSWGDQKYSTVMVPGYSGCIPKSQHYFGIRYAETSQQAISSFECEQERMQAKRKELTTLQNDPTANPALSLKPIATKAKPFLPAHIPPIHLQSDKAFMSGYTGFVPRARRFIGEGYPVITMQALKEHASEKRRLLSSQNKPVDLTQGVGQTTQSISLHRTHQVGLMPHYTGHVQGEKYSFGSTFGTSTKKAVAEIA